MAVTASTVGSELKMTMVVGVKENGEDRIGTKNIGDIKVNALDQDVFDVANAIAGIKKFPLVDILKEDKVALISE